MDLTTDHGRAQAIADGGRAGELARLVEEALQAHSSDRETDCWEQLNSIKTSFADDEMLDRIDRLADLLLEPLSEEDARLGALKLVDSLREQVQDLLEQLKGVEGSIKEAMEILERK